jgi:GntR family transcriptional regulator
MAEPHVLRIVDARGRIRRLVLRLEPTSHIPPYEQLRAQLAVMVAVGQLEPGTRLPTVRELAATLAVAPGTVARTYRELEQSGLTYGLGRRGTFIADDPPNSEPAQERQRRLDEAASQFALAVQQLGIRPEAALDAVTAALSNPA